jgi:indolepyruvate ferredoxin oxidoreductase
MAQQALPPLSLDHKFTIDAGKIYLTGVQALVRLPLVQRRADQARGRNTATFISGYPGSPLGGYDLELQRRKALLADHHIVHTMGVNEELAATSVMGSQIAQQLPDPRYDGVVGLWYGKANGFDRAMDSLRQANLCGTHRTGGALALVGDDPTAKSSPTPGASEMAAAALMMPMLYPGDVQEVLDLGLHGIAMSRCSGLWTAIKMSTQVADGSGSAFVAMDRVDPVLVAAELDGRPYEHVPSSHLYGESVLRLERSMVYARVEAALAYARANDINRITLSTPDDRIGIVATGKTYFELRQALRELGLDDAELRRLGVRLLQLRMPYPLEGRIVREFASGLREILVLEDKRPFVELFIKDELYGLTDRPLVLGKLDAEGVHLVPIHHELDTRSIARLVTGTLRRLEPLPHVEERLDRMTRELRLEPLTLSRSPYFCSGCPHNSSAAAVPEQAVVAGGTGCHVLAVFMRPEDVGSIIGITAMGNEGAQWIGASPFTGLPHLIQNVGDGTYAHSGILAIRAAIAAGVNITYKLLYNDHVAMTGAQPAVGITPVPDVVRELLAEGVKRVIITTEDTGRYAGVRLPPGVEVWDRDRMVEAQELMRRIAGVTVIVHDQECAAEKRRRRKRGKLVDPPTRVLINESVCEGCGDCGVQSNCLSVHPVETEYGRKTQIHQPSCNKDYSCLKGNCPSFLTVVPGERKPARTRVAELESDALPDPQLRVPTDEFGMRITGIGGTGVVTVAQTLATAALLDGRFVRGLDQTGLAQKGGPVISDLKITAAPVDQANKLAAADCDLYLACDLLVGAQRSNLTVTDPARTIAVISTAQVPTGHMVVDTRTAFPDPDMLAGRIVRSSRPEASVRLDAQAMSERLFGSDQVANIMLVGAAYQTGALPLTARAIEQAIELNGVAVPMNLQAFRRGRQAVSDPDGLHRAVPAAGTTNGPAGPAPAEAAATQGASTHATSAPAMSRHAREIASIVRSAPGSKLEHLVNVRVADLIAYQNRAYAVRYARRVERVRAVEAERVPGQCALAEAVAFGLYKFMAYKDEYEVARLHLKSELRADIRARFGADAGFAFRLHPPILKALGMHRKISVPGRPGIAMFGLLARLKVLRHTPLDPFGRDRVRVVERELVRQYEAVVDEIVGSLAEANHQVAVDLARLADMVRGYDEIKLRNVELYCDQVDRLLPRLSGRQATPVR